MSVIASKEKLTLDEERKVYSNEGCIERIVSVGAYSLVAGGVLGAVQASWQEASHVGVARGAVLSVIRSTLLRTSRVALLLAAAGSSFAAGECAAQTVYSLNDARHWKAQMAGGATAGLVGGLLAGTPKQAVASAALLGGLCALFAALPSPSSEQTGAKEKV